MGDLPERIWADVRFWPYVKKTESCWIWTGRTLGKGYGSLRPYPGCPTTGAHRVSWEIHHRTKVPKGAIVMHACDNPICVNPDHLSVGTHSENIRQAVERGRHKPFHPPKATHCKNGHAFTDDNTHFVMSRGLKVRRCRTCHITRLRQRRLKNGG